MQQGKHWIIKTETGGAFRTHSKIKHEAFCEKMFNIPLKSP